MTKARTPTYTVRWTHTAFRMLRKLGDRRIQGQILERADRLATEPDKQGTPLLAELAGFRSVRAVGQRYRIIYRVERKVVTVYIAAVGIRREGARDDIYALARRLVGLLEPED